MSKWQIAELSERDSWSPAEVLAIDRPVVLFTGADPAFCLGDIASVLSPDERPRLDDVVINPGDVDEVTGAVVSGRLPRGEDVGAALGRGLRRGDIAVPRSGNRPSVMISDEHIGILFTRNFLFLRVDSQHLDSLAVWAVLCSSQGREALNLLADGGTMPRIHGRALAAMQIETPAAAALPLIDHERPRPAVRLELRPALSSAWVMSAIQSLPDWQPSRALTPEGGVPLRDVADLRLSKSPKAASPADGGVIAPVLDVRHLGGEHSRGSATSLCVAPEEILTTPVVVMQPGGARRAAVANAGAVVGEGLIVIKLKPEAGKDLDLQSRRLAGFLNSPAGRRQLDDLSVGIALRRIRVRDLEGLSVPDLRTTFVPVAPDMPLAQRLSAVICAKAH